MHAVFPMKTTHVCSLFGTGSDAKTMCRNSSQRSGLKSLFPFAIEFKWTKKVRIEGGTQEPTTFLEVLNGILRATTSASWPLLAPSGCHLGGLGVCILILWEIFFISGARWGVILATRGHPGRPWEQQDGHEVVGNMIFIDFGVILEPVYNSFLNSGRSKPHSFSGLIPEGVLY